MKQLSLSDYYSLDRKIEKKNKAVKASSSDEKIIRVGLIGSFTLKGIKEALNVKCSKSGLILKSYSGEYGQYNQEILGKNSALYKFKPHLTILFIDVKDMLGEHYLFPYKLSIKERKALVLKKLEYIRSLAEVFMKHNSGKLLLNNFCVPTHSPLGILENRQDYGYFEMVRDLNRSLEETFKDNSQAYVFDYDSFLSKHGKADCYDDKMRYLADMKLNQNYIPALCDEYMKYIKALKGKSRKCIVLDLDNTLWGGIIGEDGYDGIKLGPTPPGNAFVEFQKYLLSLFGRGIILAVNSNNNEGEALRVLREHPYSVLRENHFASLKINWNNKVGNISEIAKEINIGLDSLIYIDDDKANRQMVREALPKVHVIDLPEDPALYARALKECDELDTLQITKEDMKRGSMYAQERKRKESQKSFGNIIDFLKHLNITVKFESANNFSIPRISQLTQRTNQFNLTTRRYTEEGIRRLMGSKGCRVYSVSVSDKFGDYGLTGMVSVREDRATLLVENFMLSCRVLGKSVEKAVLAFLICIAKKAGRRDIILEHIPTEKNEVARKFLKDAHFNFIRKDKKIEQWRIDASKKHEGPKHIKMVVK